MLGDQQKIPLNGGVADPTTGEMETS